VAKSKKRRAQEPKPPEEKDEIDFPTVLWSLVILAVLVLLHRLIWGG
jgi:hypothetical protein